MDVKHKQRRGFTLVEVGVYDMFPFTGHVETIGYFSRTCSQPDLIHG